MKYSDLMANWLVDLGYTHCFFVAGGNIMHLLESCSRRLKCIPVVHEVAAGIAAEYFNEVSTNGKAFALVTAGPGLTNIVTAVAGAYLESRELLVIGGQVKVADLARGELRQRGIQEIDGVEIVKPITTKSLLMDKVLDRVSFEQVVHTNSAGRKGPVFLEVPLDIQGRAVSLPELDGRTDTPSPANLAIEKEVLDQICFRLRSATRPVLLIGGGITRRTSAKMLDKLARLGVPLMTTWNGIDRIPADHPLYFGRPNTWGQRSANILLQQSNLVVALGTRLGLQQTGFNWQEFVPLGEVIQVECDPAELHKGHPRVELPVLGDANDALEYIAESELGSHDEWVHFCRSVRRTIPLVESVNPTEAGYISPYIFVEELSKLCASEDVVIPCSSGGAYTVMMQTFEQKLGQLMVTNKGLAPMGYGLSGAIGAAIAAGGKRTILVEGDGGFLQNLQELGTVSANRLNLKIFIFADNGYASIRMTQRNYFQGRYVGCDQQTGLGIPKWTHLFAAYDIPMIEVGPGFHSDESFLQEFNALGARAFLVKIDPNQTYFPKITSRITKEGSMASNPLHIMSPDLPEAVAATVMPYLQRAKAN